MITSQKKIKKKVAGKKSYKKGNETIGKVTESEVEYLILPKEHLIDIGFEKTCSCEGNKINCLTAKEWLKHQLGVWEFYYEKKDIKNKEKNLSTLSIFMSNKK